MVHHSYIEAWCVQEATFNHFSRYVYACTSTQMTGNVSFHYQLSFGVLLATLSLGIEMERLRQYKWHLEYHAVLTALTTP